MLCYAEMLWDHFDMLRHSAEWFGSAELLWVGLFSFFCPFVLNWRHVVVQHFKHEIIPGLIIKIVLSHWTSANKRTFLSHFSLVPHFLTIFFFTNEASKLVLGRGNHRFTKYFWCNKLLLGLSSKKMVVFFNVQSLIWSEYKEIKVPSQ